MGAQEGVGSLIPQCDARGRGTLPLDLGTSYALAAGVRGHGWCVPSGPAPREAGPSREGLSFVVRLFGRPPPTPASSELLPSPQRCFSNGAWLTAHSMRPSAFRASLLSLSSRYRRSSESFNGLVAHFSLAEQYSLVWMDHSSFIHHLLKDVLVVSKFWPL